MNQPSRASVALARKWRPRNFATLVGQDHVVRALTHALATRRLHHAYLLTGTRGVGKTTIARILAKALNCEVRGLGHAPDAEPCGTCRSCTEIDAQRFPDYIELDAASNRGVDEMTQLLENAIYAPSAGRFKVYVIDEVHMLSTHAFNAMLKTLEEPPGHVVFILATTDPQKVPVTVLSRCLQFNLKNMPPAAIAQHLAQVLSAEQVPFDDAALDAIGRAAAGSMRDALSLLDQAIAFGAGRVEEADVREMLGAVDRTFLARIVDAVIEGDARRAITVSDEMAERGLSFAQALTDLAGLLHRIALAQIGASGDAGVDPQQLERWAAAIDPVDVQVYYQIAVHGGRDLPLAPDEQAGFTMTLLRLFAFRPDEETRQAAANTAGSRSPAAAKAAGAATPADPRSKAAQPAMPVQVDPSVAEPADAVAPNTGISNGAASFRDEPVSPVAALRAALARPRGGAGPSIGRAGASAAGGGVSEADQAGSPALAPAVAAPSAQPTNDSDATAGPATASVSFDGDWPALAASLQVTGLAREFAMQSELLEHADGEFRVRVPIRPLAEPATVAKVRDVLAERLGVPVRLLVEVGTVQGPTAAAAASEQQAERHQRAVEAIQDDPFVRTLLADFGGTIVPGSIRPN